jgi:hypothetical protein
VLAALVLLAREHQLHLLVVLAAAGSDTNGAAE